MAGGMWDSMGEPPPPGQLCTYGKWGPLGRAFRDAEAHIMNRLWASFVWLLCLSIVTTVFIVVNPSGNEGDLGKIATVIEGLAAGTIAAAAIVTAYGLTPLARRHHWRCRWDSVALNDAGLGCWLQSRHWHTVYRPRYEITRPDGTTELRRVPVERYTFAPGDDLEAIVSEERTPAAGSYAVRWIADTEDGWRPMTLARATHRVV